MTTITELWRFPVKSMQGERVDAVEVTERGVTGDRAFALLDVETGRVASAKNPRKWGELLRWHARLVDDDSVEISGPDGTVIGSGDPDVHAVLSKATGRDVRLVDATPQGAQYEMLFPNIEGAAPDAFIAATRIADEEGGTLTAQGVAPLAPGSFVDVTPLHVIAAATLQRIGVDVRRFRPNVVVDVGGDGFDENTWAGRTLSLGSVEASIAMPTMRCVMTTLPQPGLPQDRGVLQTLARDNRVDLGGGNFWACAGAYATVTRAGTVAVGDEATIGG
jgi:uncharacterized protein YcbX